MASSTSGISARSILLRQNLGAYVGRPSSDFYPAREILGGWRSASSSSSRPPFLPRDVRIAGAARTPIGSFCGSLASLSAPRLAAAAIAAALQKAGVEADEVDAVILGQALPAGCGQNVARQAASWARIPARADCTSVNKGGASGLSAVALAAQSVALGLADVVVAVGAENMSQAPYMLRQARQGGYRFGHGTLEDSALLDGLMDAESGVHMASCVERVAEEMGITREDQDQYTVTSYRRAADAWQRGAMDLEVAPVRVRNPEAKGSTDRQTITVSYDEEYSRLKLDEVATLPPAFEEEGSITAASAASINDGAAAVVIVSQTRAKEMGLATASTRIVAFADHGMEPTYFATAPAGAVRRAMKAARMSTAEYFEIHESFAAVAIANAELLNLDPSRLNVNGGSVALGDPLGASGTRILCTLLSVLDQRSATTGCAAIANGGGGATALIVEQV